MEFLFALVIFLAAFLGLAMGLMLTGRPPKGSCGGLACVGGGACDACPRRSTETAEKTDG